MPYFYNMIFRPGNKQLFLLLSVVASLCICSCRQIDVFEKNTSIPHYKWQPGYTAKGTFKITDSLAAYNLFVVIRHTDAYKYNNIWLNLGLQAPGDTMFYQKVDLALGSDATGWYGSGMNDIWEVRKPVRQNTRFKRAGEYTFNISQAMRDNPLPGIMSVGLRVERVN